MKGNVRNHIASATAALIIIFGCDATVNSPDGGTGDGALLVQSDFSEAPVSPESDGVASVEIEGTDDVELPAEETRSFFTAFQIDPVSEDTAGPKFVVSGDIDQDGLTDLVSAWNQSQPVQVHLQRRDAEGNISFDTITLGGTNPIAIVAGLQLGQIDGDGWLDVVVLIKATGSSTWCPTEPPSEISRLEGEIMVLFNPGHETLIPDGDRWVEMILSNPFVQDRWIHNQFPGIEFKDIELSKTKPEWSGFTALAVANIDGQPGDDIVVALNAGSCKELAQDPPTNTVDLWINPGPATARTFDAWGGPTPPGLSAGVPVTLIADAPQVKDIKVFDVDGDGDLDVVTTWTNAMSENVRWVRNPLIPHEVGGPGGAAEVVKGVVPGIDLCSGGANPDAPCPDGDIDCLGIADGACIGGVCAGGPNNGTNCVDNAGCAGTENGTCVPGRWWHFATGWEERPIGQVDSGADILAIGDIDDDGFEDVMVRSTNGQIVQWFRRPNPLIEDEPQFPPDDPLPDRFNFPWPVYTLTEFEDQEPAAMAIGDVTGDGFVDLTVAVEGGIYWYDGRVADSVFDPWVPTTIVQDIPDITAGTSDTPGTGVGVESVGATTHINTLLVVDLDGDGKNDIIGTLDRRLGPGLSDDRLVWYRNTRSDEEAE